MIFVPISLGELIDKITILKIKLNKITNESKLTNIRKEYELLSAILIQQKFSEDNEEFQKLYEINLEFWNYHDWQREKWKNSCEKDTIDIELYNKNREEHILNDKRAEIKKQINLKYGSEIIEEKQFISYQI